MVRIRNPWVFQGLMEEVDRMTRDAGWAFGGTASFPDSSACGMRIGEEEAVLELELPGVEEADLVIELEGRRLRVEAVRADLHNENEEVLLRERTYGEFRRTYRLPWAVRDEEDEEVDARFRNGILVLKLRRAPESAPRRIELSTPKENQHDN